MTDSVQSHNQLRGSDGGVPRDGAELSAAELTQLFEASSNEIESTTESISSRGDALAAGSHSLAEAFSDDDDVDRKKLDSLMAAAIEGVADLEQWASDLHAILVTVEEARARLDERDDE
jgi:hypothetical protein